MNVTSTILRSLRTQLRNSAKFSTLPNEVVIFKDNDMIICWHPEPEFPYEYSLPLPEEKEDKSVLRVGAKEIRAVFGQNRMDLVREELAKITYTTKHRWYPRSRDKRAKKTEMERPYL